MSLLSEQIHVPASALLENPLRLIELLDKHKIVYTFGPNFFLTLLRDSLIAAGASFNADLSNLRALISGGESNVVATADDLTQELRRFGLQGEVVRPGFGMTETCAGSIYSRACPSSDLAKGLEFANLGTCIPGIELRILKAGDVPAKVSEVGDLQVSGPIVFDHYFNNLTATKESFTADGWFNTGDLAFVDASGNLNLTGRTKDTIIVNGVKWSSTEIETAVEEEGIPGVVHSYTVAFPYRATNSPTEEICVVYAPAYSTDDDHARFETATAIGKTVSLITGKKPDHLIPLPPNLLEKSSLGKISRTKVRAAFEKGEYAAFEKGDTDALTRYQNSQFKAAETKTEKVVQETLAQLLEIPAADIGMGASIFDLGITSFNLITLKASIERNIKTEVDIPMSIMLVE